MHIFTKRNLLISGSVVILLGLSVGIYWYMENQRPYDAWNLIPGEPVLVLETTELNEGIQEISTQPIWQTISTTPYFGTISERLSYLMLILAEKGGQHFFQNKKLLASLHLTSKNDFDALFYLPIQTEEDQYFYNQVLMSFRQNRAYRFRTRNYGGYQIHEIHLEEEELRFSFTLHRDFLIASYTSLLVEDVIRKINTSEQAFVFAQQKEIDRLQKIPRYQSRKFSLYVNNRSLLPFLNLMIQEKLKPYFKPMSSFADHIFLNLREVSNHWQLEGQSYVQAEDTTSFLHVFQGQAGGNFDLVDYIPAETAVFYHLSFSQTPTFIANWRRYWQREDRTFRQRQWALKNEYQFPLEDFYKNLQEEMGLCLVESRSGLDTDKLFLIKTHSLTQAIRQLNELGEVAAQSVSRKPASLQHEGHQIRQIYLNELPRSLFGAIAQGFSDCYYAPIGQYVVMANNIQVLRQYLDQVAARRVWSQNAEYRSLKNFLFPKAQLTMHVNINQAWSAIYQNSSEPWQQILNAYERQIKALHQLTFQVQGKGEHYATRLLMQPLYRASEAKEVAEGYELHFDTNLPDAIYTPPYLVKNHHDRSWEILVQSFHNEIFLLSPEGKLRWKFNAGAPIRSDVHQIDIYNNDKLQYLYLTADRIGLLDRLGRNVPRYPIFLPDTTHLQTLALFDFDQNDQHHYLISDRRGQLYMYDEEKNRIPGWRPKRLNRPLACPAQHVRIQETDFILAQQEDGDIYAFSREGQVMAGFPIKLPTKLGNPLWISPGIDPIGTKVTMLSEEGQLVDFNLIGEILEDRQLDRHSARTRFHLCADQENRDWIMAATSRGHVKLMDKLGKSYFEKEYESNSDQIEVQYFKLGANLEVVAVTFRVDSYTYLYDLQGKPLGKPFRSNQKIALQYQAQNRSLLIHRVHGNKVGKLELKLEQ